MTAQLGQRLRAVLPTHVVIFPEDTERYNAARSLTNTKISHHPLCIVQPKTNDHISIAIKEANNAGTSISIKNGGHSNTGFSVVDGSVMIDMCHMTQISIDKKSKVIHVGGGCLWGDVYKALDKTNFVVVGGSCPTVGVAGLVLGGGKSFLSPKYGLASDNLVSADIITADGALITASETENEDLHWSLRGAGQGSFGVVTKFALRLHEVETPKFWNCTAVYPKEKVYDVLDTYERFHKDDRILKEVCATTTIVSDEKGKFIVVDMAYLGAPQQGRQVFSAFFTIEGVSVKREGANTVLEICNAPSWGPPGATTKRGGFVRSLDDHVIDMLVDVMSHTQVSKPGSSCYAFIEYWHGKITNVHKLDTPLYHRKKQAQILFGTFAPTVADEQLLVPWAFEATERLSRYLIGATPNTPDASMIDWARQYYRNNYSRLRDVKKRFDPDNLFRHPHSVRLPPLPEPPASEQDIEDDSDGPREIEEKRKDNWDLDKFPEPLEQPFIAKL